MAVHLNCARKRSSKLGLEYVDDYDEETITSQASTLFWTKKLEWVLSLTKEQSVKYLIFAGR